MFLVGRHRVNDHLAGRRKADGGIINSLRHIRHLAGTMIVTGEWEISRNLWAEYIH